MSSSESRTALPRRTKAAIVSAIARVGHTRVIGARKMFRKPSLTMTPQVGTVGSPRPRNSSADWMEIAMPQTMAVWMMIGALTTERM